LEREQFAQARLMAVVVNYSFCAPKEPVTVADFLPGSGAPKVEERTDEEIAAHINAVMLPISVTVAPV
jgi:hypothetical protein